MKIVTIALLGGALVLLSDILALADRTQEDARETLVTYQLNDA